MYEAKRSPAFERDVKNVHGKAAGRQVAAPPMPYSLPAS